MKTNTITLMISLVILLGALRVLRVFDAGAYAHGRYYATAVLMICAILIFIALMRLIGFAGSRSMAPRQAGRYISNHPRQHYRLRFDEAPPPQFIQISDDCQSAAAFTCPVCDVSETGVGLVCTGVYRKGQVVKGELIFDSGRTVEVDGIVVREATDRTALRLRHNLDPALLMAEQRERIVKKKANGPQPAVNKPALGSTTGTLPSHSIKGICRLKRP